jgi:hypothetical protein
MSTLKALNGLVNVRHFSRLEDIGLDLRRVRSVDGGCFGFDSRVNRDECDIFATELPPSSSLSFSTAVKFRAALTKGNRDTSLGVRHL